MAESEAGTTAAAESITAGDQTPVPDQDIFHLDIHAWIEAQQTSHGVRHDDYGQYHSYCTRRLARLSHNREAKPYLVHSSKYASSVPVPSGEDATSTANKKTSKKSSRGRHAFCSRSHDTFSKNNSHVPHVNILWYLLVSAERSWAHANQIQKQHGKRQQVLKKLKRAKDWAHRLLEMATTSTDDSTIKECHAYVAWMSANYDMERMNYQVSRFLD
jgi:signal recognition particle subunit SRP68